MNPIEGLLLVSIVCAGICYAIAKKRGSNVPYWMVLALLIGPFAVPFVFYSKSKNTTSASG
jgi:hypothetical protein